MVLYGASGVGKTTQAYYVARDLYRRTGKRVRLLSWEDSSKLVFAPLIAAGEVEALWMSNAKDQLSAARLLKRGTWFVGGGLQPVEEWRGQVSGYIIEGLTAWAEAILRTLRETGRFKREQGADAFTIGNEAFQGSSQTAYGFAQDEVMACLQSIAALPVELVLWTAREVSATGGIISEDGAVNKVPIVGPELVGSAKTARVQAYVSTQLHATVEEKRRVVYFQPHHPPGNNNIWCPAKFTAPPPVAAKIKAAYPAGKFEVTLEGGLVEFLHRLACPSEQTKQN